MEDAHVWFVRFSLDHLCNVLACGTRNGRIFVWDPATVSMHPLCTLKRGTSPKMTVRINFQVSKLVMSMLASVLGSNVYMSH